MPSGQGVLCTYDPNIGDTMVLLSTEVVQVQLEDLPFAKGGCREAFLCRLAEVEGGAAGPGLGKKLVAKRYLRKDEFTEDFIGAHLAQSFAQKFNEKNPPKKIRFLVPNRVLTFNGHKYSLEEFLEGRWQKHNNIFGMMESLNCTPSAFSHFTYQASGQKLMILDVQGVGETYTDPAVVSTCQGKFGYTDTGKAGIREFFQEHKCSHICELVLAKENSAPGHVPTPGPTSLTSSISSSAVIPASPVVSLRLSSPSGGSRAHPTAEVASAAPPVTKARTSPSQPARPRSRSRSRSSAYSPPSTTTSTTISSSPQLQPRSAYGGHHTNGGRRSTPTTTTTTTSLPAPLQRQSSSPHHHHQREGSAMACALKQLNMIHLTRGSPSGLHCDIKVASCLPGQFGISPIGVRSPPASSSGLFRRLSTSAVVGVTSSILCKESPPPTTMGFTRGWEMSV